MATEVYHETGNGKPPRARVYLDFIGWNVKITGRHVVQNAHWTREDAIAYAELAVSNARREWYASGCKRCHGYGYLPKWPLDPETGEPGKKPCDCQPDTAEERHSDD